MTNKPRILPARNFSMPRAEFAYSCWLLDLAKVKAADGSPFTIDDVMRPDFWQHHSAKGIRENDIIRVLAHDRSFDIDLCVIATGTGGLMLRPRLSIVEPRQQQATPARAGKVKEAA